MRVPLSMPSLSEMERRLTGKAMESGWISGTGPDVSGFEAALSQRVGRKFAIATSSGTSALEIALLAMGVGAGDEVIVPALTFAAPAAAVRTIGASAVLCDVTQDSWTIDPKEIARLITKKTKAIIAVDCMGHPCDFDALNDLGVPIIEDAAEAHGSMFKGRNTGSFGDMAIFSFHANKCITTGEGGCVLTDDEEAADRIRMLTNHGMRPSRPYYHEVVGRNARMTNLSAAIGFAQVTRWEELTKARIKAGEYYLKALADADFTSRPVACWAEIVPWLHTVVLEEGRDKIVALVREKGIDVRPVWPALCDLPLYLASVIRPCPVASYISSVAVWLPTWSHMERRIIMDVVSCLQTARNAVWK